MDQWSTRLSPTSTIRGCLQDHDSFSCLFIIIFCLNSSFIFTWFLLSFAAGHLPTFFYFQDCKKVEKMEGSGFLKKHCLKDTSTNLFDSCDYLSVLPDPLLLHILSFLPMKDVIKSSFLSRRWRSLWMHVPTIDFTWSSGEDQSLYRTVDRFLVYYKAMKIQKFHVECWYEDAYFINVNSWINFIMGRDVITTRARDSISLDKPRVAKPYLLP